MEFGPSRLPSLLHTPDRKLLQCSSEGSPPTSLQVMMNLPMDKPKMPHTSHVELGKFLEHARVAALAILLILDFELT